ncbi:MAG: MFS transporter [Candidatus Levyibacteriota bacterium]
MLKKYFSGLSKDTFLLSATSLFADISTEMLYPVLPLYLTQVLRVDGSIIGLIEGIATATQNIAQGFSGWISDRIQNRKNVALIGFSLAAISKPLIGFSASWQHVLGARFLDRFGTGTRSTPRDALIASSVEEQNRGKAFGLEGFGDNLGAFLGPLLAIFLLFSLSFSMRTIFYIAFIPGAFAVLMVAFVKEKKQIARTQTKIKIRIREFPARYWEYLFVVLVFGMGNSTSAFLILETKSLGASVILTIFIYALYNLVAALSSYPAGSLSDKLGRKNILLFAFFVFLLVYVGFAVSKNIVLIGALFMLYGVYQGVFRAVGKALATDLSPQHVRASGIGWYSATVGLSGLAASIIAGQLWDKVSHPAVFLYGAAFSFLGILALLFLVKLKNPLFSSSSTKRQ